MDDAACVIETERLALRRLGAQDGRFMLGLLNQPSFLENIGDRGVRTIQQAEAYIANGAVASYEKNGFGLYLVVVKDTGEAAGICGLVKRDGLEDVDIGFAFLPAYWGQGYAVESAAAVKAFARDTVGLKRLVAITTPANRPSMRVLEKIGLSFEKTVRVAPDGEELNLFACQFPAPPAP